MQQENRGTTFHAIGPRRCGLGCALCSTRLLVKFLAKPAGRTQQPAGRWTRISMRRRRKRDDGQLVKPTGSSADVDPLEALIRVVNEAQERDTEDERSLYHPMRADRPSSCQRWRSDRR